MLVALFRLLLLIAVCLAAYFWIRRGFGRSRRARREVATARAAFVANERLGELFRAAAQATGKPRGLRWKRCELTEEPPLLARDIASGELFALAGVTIAFEAEPDGDMEEVEAVGDLRDATAVFAWREGRWQTDGRAVFNLPPAAALDRYRGSLLPV